MSSIRGRYEYDDEGLTPGASGNRAVCTRTSSTRTAISRVVPVLSLMMRTANRAGSRKAETLYMPGEGGFPHRTEAQRQRGELAQAVVRALLELAIERGTPHAKRLGSRSFVLPSRHGCRGGASDARCVVGAVPRRSPKCSRQRLSSPIWTLRPSPRSSKRT